MSCGFLLSILAAVCLLLFGVTASTDIPKLGMTSAFTTEDSEISETSTTRPTNHNQTPKLKSWGMPATPLVESTMSTSPEVTISTLSSGTLLPNVTELSGKTSDPVETMTGTSTNKNSLTATVTETGYLDQSVMNESAQASASSYVTTTKLAMKQSVTKQGTSPTSVNEHSSFVGLGTLPAISTTSQLINSSAETVMAAQTQSLSTLTTVKSIQQTMKPEFSSPLTSATMMGTTVSSDNPSPSVDKPPSPSTLENNQFVGSTTDIFGKLMTTTPKVLVIKDSIMPTSGPPTSTGDASSVSTPIVKFSNAKQVEEPSFTSEVSKTTISNLSPPVLTAEKVADMTTTPKKTSKDELQAFFTSDKTTPQSSLAALKIFSSTLTSSSSTSKRSPGGTIQIAQDQNSEYSQPTKRHTTKFTTMHVSSEHAEVRVEAKENISSTTDVIAGTAPTTLSKTLSTTAETMSTGETPFNSLTENESTETTLQPSAVGTNPSTIPHQNMASLTTMSIPLALTQINLSVKQTARTTGTVQKEITASMSSIMSPQAVTTATKQSTVLTWSPTLISSKSTTYNPINLTQSTLPTPARTTSTEESPKQRQSIEAAVLLTHEPSVQKAAFTTVQPNTAETAKLETETTLPATTDNGMSPDKSSSTKQPQTLIDQTLKRATQVTESTTQTLQRAVPTSGESGSSQTSTTNQATIDEQKTNSNIITANSGSITTSNQAEPSTDMTITTKTKRTMIRGSNTTPSQLITFPVKPSTTQTQTLVSVSTTTKIQSPNTEPLSTRLSTSQQSSKPSTSRNTTETDSIKTTLSGESKTPETQIQETTTLSPTKSLVSTAKSTKRVPDQPSTSAVFPIILFTENETAITASITKPLDLIPSPNESSTTQKQKLVSVSTTTQIQSYPPTSTKTTEAAQYTPFPIKSSSTSTPMPVSKTIQFQLKPSSSTKPVMTGTVGSTTDPSQSVPIPVESSSVSTQTLMLASTTTKIASNLPISTKPSVETQPHTTLDKSPVETLSPNTEALTIRPKSTKLRTSSTTATGNLSLRGKSATPEVQVRETTTSLMRNSSESITKSFTRLTINSSESATSSTVKSITSIETQSTIEIPQSARQRETELRTTGLSTPNDSTPLSVVTTISDTQVKESTVVLLKPSLTSMKTSPTRMQTSPSESTSSLLKYTQYMTSSTTPLQTVSSIIKETTKETARNIHALTQLFSTMTQVEETMSEAKTLTNSIPEEHVVSTTNEEVQAEDFSLTVKSTTTPLQMTLSQKTSVAATLSQTTAESTHLPMTELDSSQSSTSSTEGSTNLTKQSVGLTTMQNTRQSLSRSTVEITQAITTNPTTSFPSLIELMTSSTQMASSHSIEPQQSDLVAESTKTIPFMEAASVKSVSTSATTPSLPFATFPTQNTRQPQGLTATLTDAAQSVTNKPVSSERSASAASQNTPSTQTGLSMKATVTLQSIETVRPADSKSAMMPAHSTQSDAMSTPATQSARLHQTTNIHSTIGLVVPMQSPLPTESSLNPQSATDQSLTTTNSVSVAKPEETGFTTEAMESWKPSSNAVTSMPLLQPTMTQKESTLFITTPKMSLLTSRSLSMSRTTQAAQPTQSEVSTAVSVETIVQSKASSPQSATKAASSTTTTPGSSSSQAGFTTFSNGNTGQISQLSPQIFTNTLDGALTPEKQVIGTAPTDGTPTSSLGSINIKDAVNSSLKNSPANISTPEPPPLLSSKLMNQTPSPNTLKSNSPPSTGVSNITTDPATLQPFIATDLSTPNPTNANITHRQFDSTSLRLLEGNIVFFKYSPKIATLMPLVFEYPVVIRTTFPVADAFTVDQPNQGSMDEI